MKLREGVALAALVVLSPAPSMGAGPVTVGTYVAERHETPHPYRGGGETPVWSTELRFPGAPYIAAHFGVLDLAPGDRVVVRSPDGKQSRTYRGLGRQDLGRSANGFFATHVNGEAAIVELFAAEGSQGFGMVIDYFARGYSQDEIDGFWAQGLGREMNLPPPRAPQAICGVDDSREAKCYQVSEPNVYEESRSVARLLISGIGGCTGWLFGCEGHLMTNEHCIGDSTAAANTDYEFMAEGATCADDCAATGACPGVVEATGGSLVRVDASHDYALVLPDTGTGTGTNLPVVYGYLQVRPSGPVLNERIYIPGHPLFEGKRLVVESSEDAGGFAIVNALGTDGCVSAPGFLSNADTDHGSSGSPVLGITDNLVVGLHNCGFSFGCGVTSVDIRGILTSLGPDTPACATCTAPAVPAGLTAIPAGPNAIDLSWTASPGALSYDVYRAQGACPQPPLGFARIATAVTGTTFTDATAQGGLTYSYVVRAVNGCASDPSVCTSAVTTGSCTLLPSFGGLTDLTNAGQPVCALNLAWNAGSPVCGSSLVYNVYRSTTLGFTPGPSNLFARCLTETTFTDTSMPGGITHYYTVRAEDDSGPGSGPCRGGNEDTNIMYGGLAATGPMSVVFQDDLEAGAGNWTTSGTGVGPWTLSEASSHSPTHSWEVVHATGSSDQQLALASPMTILPGAILSFWHSRSLTPADGGVLEYSLDGTTWVDILDGVGPIPPNSQRLLQDFYSVQFSDPSNPLFGREGWGAAFDPAFTEPLVDMADFVGFPVYLRWRFGGGDLGTFEWHVDDVSITGGPCTSGPAADLTISKTDGSATAVPGLPVTYTITAGNGGPGAVVGAAVADAFPAGLGGVSWTCTATPGSSCSAGGAGNIADTVNLAVGGTATYLATGTLDPAATGSLANTATIAAPAGATETNPSNNAAADTDTLTPQADVSTTKTDGQTTAVPGQPIAYTIVVTNTGPSVASGATVTDTIPSALTGATWTCVGSGGGTCAASGSGSINDVVGLPTGATLTYTLTGTVSASATGSLANTASVTAPPGVTDPNTSNNSATDTDTLTPQADVSVVKTDSVDPVDPGGALTYSLAVTNAGPSVSAVSLVDALPPNVSFVSVTPGPPTCSESAGTVACSLGSLGPAVAVSVDIAVTLDPLAGGTLTNTGSITGSVFDPVTANDTDTETTAILAPPLPLPGELVHGSSQWEDLATRPGPVADSDLFRILQRPHSSWEVVVDGASADVASGSGPRLERIGSDGVTVVQSSDAAGAGGSRSLRWENPSASPVGDERVRVESDGCTIDCQATDVYRIRAWDTTYAVSRFNNSGTQVSVLLLQGTGDQAVDGHLWFWDGAGALVASQSFTLLPRGTLVLNTSTLPGAGGVSGSVTVSSNGRYGELLGKVVALEPATGFTFDTPLVPRQR